MHDEPTERKRHAPRPRIRTIKPEAPQDERIGRLSRDARLLFFTGLVTMADDEGRMRAMPSLVIGHTFPYDDDVSPAKLRRWLDEIEHESLILRYEHEGTPYIAIRHWAKHQRPNRATASILPPPPDHAVVSANAVNVPEAGTSDSVTEHGENTEHSSPRAQARGSSSSSPSSSVEVEDDARADVTRLCHLLAEKIRENDPKAKVRPDSGGWRTEARLLLDRDERPVDQAAQLIAWCQADSFWRANILSMRKFREQYPKLLLRMRSPSGRAPNGGGITAEDLYAEIGRS